MDVFLEWVESMCIACTVSVHACALLLSFAYIFIDKSGLYIVIMKNVFLL